MNLHESDNYSKNLLYDNIPKIMIRSEWIEVFFPTVNIEWDVYTYICLCFKIKEKRSKSNTRTLFYLLPIHTCYFLIKNIFMIVWLNELILIKDTFICLHNEKKNWIVNIVNTYYNKHRYNEKKKDGKEWK